MAWMADDGEQRAGADPPGTCEPQGGVPVG